VDEFCNRESLARLSYLPPPVELQRLTSGNGTGVNMNFSWSNAIARAGGAKEGAAPRTGSCRRGRAVT
jgi:hypothetical protein